MIATGVASTFNLRVNVPANPKIYINNYDVTEQYVRSPSVGQDI